MSKLNKYEIMNLQSKIYELEDILDKIQTFDQFEHRFSYENSIVYNNFVMMLENKINEWEEKLE